MAIRRSGGGSWDVRHYLLVLALAGFAGPVQAQPARSGWYGGLEVGLANAGGMTIEGTTDDVPTNCDQHLGPATVNGEDLPWSLSDPRCTRSETWETNTNITNGPMIGASFGLGGGLLRLEAEYVYRQQGGSFAESAVAGDKQAEFIRSGDRMSDLRTHQLFGNIYFDGQFGQRVIPYLGAGIGYMSAKAHYSTEFLRNPDEDVMRRLGRNPNAAGTLSTEQETLSDRMWAYQYIAGVDYLLRDGVFIGLKVRSVKLLGHFQDGDSPDLLRSHAPTVAPGGSPVTYEVRTKEFHYWGLSLGLKYFF